MTHWPRKMHHPQKQLCGTIALLCTTIDAKKMICLYVCCPFERMWICERRTSDALQLKRHFLTWVTLCYLIVQSSDDAESSRCMWYANMTLISVTTCDVRERERERRVSSELTTVRACLSVCLCSRSRQVAVNIHQHYIVIDCGEYRIVWWWEKVAINVRHQCKDGHRARERERERVYLRCNRMINRSDSFSLMLVLRFRPPISLSLAVSLFRSSCLVAFTRATCDSY